MGKIIQPRRLPDDRKAMLAMLREARATVYRDAESFDEAATVLEHVGQMLLGNVKNGLNDYQTAICGLARQAPAIQCERVDPLFDTVRRARNDSVHSGDFIRHHTTRLVELILVLEEALSMPSKLVGDLMVQNHTTAQLWHNVSAVRRAMLTHSFSFLPLQDPNGDWKLLSDVAIVRYLRQATKTNDRNILLGKKVGDAIKDHDLQLTTCDCVSPDKPVEQVAQRMQTNIPVLVVEQDGTKGRLVGILTAFDLL